MKQLNNIYNKDYSNRLDNLTIRTSAPKYTQYWDNSQRNIKRCKIVVDSWDKGKILTSMYYNHKATKEITTDYYLDLENGLVRKLKEVIRYYNKHNLTINYNLVYRGTKSMATKKLENELKKVLAE